MRVPELRKGWKDVDGGAYELIRRKVLIDGLSRREVARELDHSRKTIDKALPEAMPSGYRQQPPRKQPALEPMKAVIDA